MKERKFVVTISEIRQPRKLKGQERPPEPTLHAHYRQEIEEWQKAAIIEAANRTVVEVKPHD